MNHIEQPQPGPDQATMEKLASEGLSQDEVERLTLEGKTNVPPKSNEKSDLRIIAENVFSFFNTVLYVVAALLAFFMIYLRVSGNGEIEQKYFGVTKFLFLLAVLGNVVIGSIQGLKAKRTLRRLKLLTASQVTVVRGGKKEKIDVEKIVLGDVLFLSAGEQVMVDGTVLKGWARLDESMLTGESRLVEKKQGDALYSGSLVSVGSFYALVTEVGGNTYASKMYQKVQSLQGHKSELMVGIKRILNAMAVLLFIIVAVVIGTLCYKVNAHPDMTDIAPGGLASVANWARIIVTTSGFAIGVVPTGLALLTSIALAVSIIKLAKEKTLVQELFSLENLSRADVICLDKTGTLTDGTMVVVGQKSFVPEEEFLLAVKRLLGAFESQNVTSAALIRHFGADSAVKPVETYPFSSAEKKSGYKDQDGSVYWMGAPDRIASSCPEALEYASEEAKKTHRVIAFAKGEKIIGLVALRENIRETAPSTLAYFAQNNVEVKIISGDNVETVQAIAETCGVLHAEKAISLFGVELEKIPELASEYTIFARVSPEQKQALVEALQAKGHKVAMTGDGVNDILALRKANASITFASATDAAKSCADVVLLDDDFVHLKTVVSEGRRVVNNIQRTAVLFLMKTIAISLLAFFLIPFHEGQFTYKIENVYLLETAIIGTGGFFLSLESNPKPIRGKFHENVLSMAVPSGLFLFICMLVPAILYQLGVFGTFGTVDARGAMVVLTSVLTALSGLSAVLALSVPFTKYRVVVCLLVLGNVLLFALGLPRVFLEGSAIHFDGDNVNILLREAFQPWNSGAIDLLAKTPSKVWVYWVFGVYFVVMLPGYVAIIRLGRRFMRHRIRDLTRLIHKG